MVPVVVLLIIGVIFTGLGWWADDNLIVVIGLAVLIVTAVLGLLQLAGRNRGTRL